MNKDKQTAQYALNKILRNEPLSEQELQQLQEILNAELETDEPPLLNISEKELNRLLLEHLDLLHPQASPNQELSEHEARRIFSKAAQQLPGGRPLRWKDSIKDFAYFWQKFFQGPVVVSAGATMIALFVLIVPFFLLKAPKQSNVGEKGVLQLINANPSTGAKLGFVVGGYQDGKLRLIERGTSGQRYSQDQLIVIKYSLNEPSYICLLHQDQQREVEILLQATPEQTEAGEFLLGERDSIWPVSLAQAQGQHDFYLYVSQRPFSCRLLTKIPRGIQGDHFTVEVR